jgi:Uma2 family endonuclease
VNTLPEIEKAILTLPSAERVRLIEWFSSIMQTPRGVAEPTAGYAGQLRFPLTFEEYLEFEEHSRNRHEYLAGEIFAMSGVTKLHNRIAGRFYNAFTGHLKGRPCEPFIGDVKVKFEVNRDTYVYYPDVMVVCDRNQQEDRYVADPKLIVEVLSPSTAGVDRHEKRINYRWIQALEEYVIVAQEMTSVTIFRRLESWQPVVIESLDAILELRSIGLAVPLAQIYKGE